MLGVAFVMNYLLEQAAERHGDRLRIIDKKHLTDLKDIIEDFKKSEALNDFQKWIVDEKYQFEVPDGDLKINSIILIAVHHPFCAKVNFVRNGKKYTFLSLVRPEFNENSEYLSNFAKEYGYSFIEAPDLPMKRLAVHSGLAKYGRNNITYIDGLGSNFSYYAYFSDMLCEDDTWGEMQNEGLCNSCKLCIANCPTGAICKDRFLIDNQKCLSCINEVTGEIPTWVPVTVHHTLYDCLICQRVCPMNAKQRNDVVEGIYFTEEETDMLLEGKPIDTFSDNAQSKIKRLGLDEWYAAIPRNLEILFQQDTII